MKDIWLNIDRDDIKVGDTIKIVEIDEGDDVVTIKRITKEYLYDQDDFKWDKLGYYGDELQYEVLVDPNEKPKDDQFWWQDESQQGTLARALRNTKDKP